MQAWKKGGIRNGVEKKEEKNSPTLQQRPSLRKLRLTCENKNLLRFRTGDIEEYERIIQVWSHREREREEDALRNKKEKGWL